MVVTIKPIIQQKDQHADASEHSCQNSVWCCLASRSVTHTDLVILVYFVHEGVGRHDFSLVVIQQCASLCHADVGLLQIPRCRLKETTE